MGTATSTDSSNHVSLAFLKRRQPHELDQNAWHRQTKELERVGAGRLPTFFRVHQHLTSGSKSSTSTSTQNHDQNTAASSDNLLKPLCRSLNKNKLHLEPSFHPVLVSAANRSHPRNPPSPSPTQRTAVREDNAGGKYSSEDLKVADDATFAKCVLCKELVPLAILESHSNNCVLKSADTELVRCVICKHEIAISECLEHSKFCAMMHNNKRHIEPLLRNDRIVAVSYDGAATPTEKLLPMLYEFSVKVKCLYGFDCVFWMDRISVPNPTTAEVNNFGTIFERAAFTLGFDIGHDSILKRGWCLTECCLSIYYLHVIPSDPVVYFQAKDLQSSHVELTEARAKQCKRIFAEYDFDGKGCISMKDIGAALQSLGQFHSEKELENIADLLLKPVECCKSIDFNEFLRIFTRGAEVESYVGTRDITRTKTGIGLHRHSLRNVACHLEVMVGEFGEYSRKSAIYEPVLMRKQALTRGVSALLDTNRTKFTVESDRMLLEVILMKKLRAISKCHYTAKAVINAPSWHRDVDLRELFQDASWNSHLPLSFLNRVFDDRPLSERKDLHSIEKIDMRKHAFEAVRAKAMRTINARLRDRNGYPVGSGWGLGNSLKHAFKANLSAFLVGPKGSYLKLLTWDLKQSSDQLFQVFDVSLAISNGCKSEELMDAFLSKVRDGNEEALVMLTGDFTNADEWRYALMHCVCA